MKFFLHITILLTALNFSYTKLNAQVLPLDTILSIVSQNNPELKMYEAKGNELDQYATGAKSWSAPMVEAGLWMVPYNFEANQGQFMIEADQNIPNPAKLKANANYLGSLSLVEKSNQKFQANDLFSQAKMNYMQLVILQKKIKLIQQNLDALQFIGQTAQTAYQYNKGSLSDFYQVQARQYELQNLLSDLENQMMQKRVALNTLMYRDVNTIFEVDTAYAIKNYESTPVDTSQLSNSRSDMQALSQSIKNTQLNEKLQWKQRLPDFSLSYGHMQGFGAFPNQFTLMGGISLPIAPWSSKSYKANSSAQKFEAAQLQDQKESILNETKGMLKTIALQIASDKQQKENYEKHILPSMERNYETTLTAYQQNSGELPDLMNAWLMLKNAELDYYDKIGDLLQQQIEFEKQMEIF